MYSTNISYGCVTAVSNRPHSGQHNMTKVRATEGKCLVNSRNKVLQRLAITEVKWSIELCLIHTHTVIFKS